jgi:cyclic pyranopterin phosphate synthase
VSAAGGLNHADDEGRPVMVDVSAKQSTTREATASGVLVMDESAFARLTAGELPKGAVAPVARIAGIQAAKRAAELIPMCHPLLVSHVAVDVEPEPALPGLVATATVRCQGPTGVEMEALTAVTVALLAAYDMLKALDRSMRITDIRLLGKSGGRSGDYAVGGWSARDAPP